MRAVDLIAVVKSASPATHWRWGVSEYPHKRIWLNYETDPNFPTWCQDKINDSDFEYVAAPEIERLREALQKIIDHFYQPAAMDVSAADLSIEIRQLKDIARKALAETEVSGG